MHLYVLILIVFASLSAHVNSQSTQDICTRRFGKGDFALNDRDQCSKCSCTKDGIACRLSACKLQKPQTANSTFTLTMETYDKQLQANRNSTATTGFNCTAKFGNDRFPLNEQDQCTQCRCFQSGVSCQLRACDTYVPDAASGMIYMNTTEFIRQREERKRSNGTLPATNITTLVPSDAAKTPLTVLTALPSILSVFIFVYSA